MSDRLDRLERTMESLTDTVRDLQTRLAALEGARAEKAGPAVEPSAPGAPSSPEALSAASASARGSLAAKLPQAGRTFLVLGGAFLLRALTDAGILPPPAGVSLGLAYALTWIGFAHREATRQRPTSAAFHGLASVLVAYPLLFEGAIRFDVFSPIGVAVALTAVTTIGIVAAWRSHLRLVAWWFTLAATATIISLMFATARPILFSALLVGLGVATLGLAYTRNWVGQQWLVAIPANLAVLRTSFMVSQPESGAMEVSTSGVQTLVVAFLLSYLGTFAGRRSSSRFCSRTWGPSRL
jgi:hypothetical protein